MTFFFGLLLFAIQQFVLYDHVVVGLFDCFCPQRFLVLPTPKSHRQDNVELSLGINLHCVAVIQLVYH